MAGLFLSACVAPAGDDAPPGSGGSSAETGGSKGSGSGGKSASGGSTASGGTTGTTSSGGVTGTGGKASSGGSGGIATGSGGVTGTATGGTTPTTGSGGASSGSGGIVPGSGGAIGTGARGGAPGTGGARGGSTGTGSGGSMSMTGGAGAGGVVTVDCDASPPSGGMVHSSSNASGTAAGLDWTIWSNGSGGSITTYSSAPAFSAAWNNSGDFLARIGVQWNNSKTFDQYGTIAAQFAEKRTGSGGGYSYIGIYGWSTNPCIEFYIVDDSFNTMPVNPGNTTNKGTVDIDDGSYILYTRATSGTGGSKCSGVSNWTQFYSVRKTARKCGTITISDHFKAWAAAGMTLGKMDQAQILVEVGGGSGSIDFSTANVTTSM